MEESTSREKVLKNIRNALINVADNPFPRVDFNAPVYQPMEEALDITFAQEFTRAGGQFIFCEDEKEFVRNFELLANQNAWDDVFCADDYLNELLVGSAVKMNKGDEQILKTRISLTSCEYLVARPGSIMVSSKNAGGRRMNVFPDIHVVVAYTNQLVPDIKQAFAHISNKYGKKLPSLITLVTGPSRTADIEKTLVMGAHGPRELYLFLIDLIQQ
ncbi:MAG TPA: lactate utilization protein [Bacteroidales bacterium]|nr:lactate utilization protein [Bacteroidales bacterium]HSA42892.1 lactate utilization protein [Bacteroidales bacterium]